MDHPYHSAPDRAFWSRAVSKDWQPESLIEETLVRTGDALVSAGSCFAANLVPYLEAAGHRYLRTEQLPSQFADDENLGYRNFSAAYGNIYTVRQMLQLLRRATGRFAPREDRCREGTRRRSVPSRVALSGDRRA